MRKEFLTVIAVEIWKLGYSNEHFKWCFLLYFLGSSKCHWTSGFGTNWMGIWKKEKNETLFLKKFFVLKSDHFNFISKVKRIESANLHKLLFNFLHYSNSVTMRNTLKTYRPVLSRLNSAIGHTAMIASRALRLLAFEWTILQRLFSFDNFTFYTN